MTPPVAVVTHASLARRLARRLAEPPRWASSLSLWTLSASFLASVGHVLSVFAREEQLGTIYLWRSLGIFFFAALTACVLFVPLLLSAVMYLVLFRTYGPRSGALWSLAVHIPAHLVIVAWFLGLPWYTNLYVPLLVAGLWGLWLGSLARRREPARLAA
ncbi:MAG: hypothetical protein R3B48_01660 [Kofleriaceae bacterium]